MKFHKSRLQSDPIVTVREGQLRGTVDTLHDGSSYYGFKGIPYAEPPVGKLRFKAPVSPKPWHGVYDATKHGAICPQYDTTMRMSAGDENCLFLNVYTKSLKVGSNMPVMVFIHGGAYSYGSGNDDLYGPKYLLEHDVILVTFNYRLEVLGFLCLDTPEVPGNAGMKDQVAALQWVKKNIAMFGGDPNNVTIFGESAGSSSVTYHMLSPMSKGLFHKAIAQSGVCIQDWATDLDKRERAFRIGKVLGKDTKDPDKLLEFLQNLPASNLVNLSKESKNEDERYRGILMHFVPVVEEKFENVTAFISDWPLDMILADKLNNVPLLIGYNSDEGIITLNETLKQIDFFNKNPHYKVPREISKKVSLDTEMKYGANIKNFYTNGGEFKNENLKGIVDLESDLVFIYQTHRFISHSRLETVYMYKFNYDTELNVLKKIMGFEDLEGACHGDELFYIFSNNFTNDTYNDNDYLKAIVKEITKLWTNFAKTGNPTPDNSFGVIWEPYTKANKEYLNINHEMFMGRYADKERMEFWNKLFCDAGLPYITKSSL